MCIMVFYGGDNICLHSFYHGYPEEEGIMQASSRACCVLVTSFGPGLSFHLGNVPGGRLIDRSLVGLDLYALRYVPSTPLRVL